MTLFETFVGSFIEAISLCCLLNLFNAKYLSSPVKALLVAVAVASVTTATDALLVPVGYLINYVAFIVLLSVIIKIKLFNVFFEFIFALATYAITQILLVFIANTFNIANSLRMTDRMIHLIIALIICIIITNNKKLQFKFRSFYSNFREQIYLIAGNLFILAIMGIYLWDTDIITFFTDISIISIFLILWCIMNVYLLKKLVDNRRQKEIITLNEQYITMTENLLNGLYAEKHDFKKHLQTIEGLIHTNEPNTAVKSIEDYIIDVSSNDKQMNIDRISFHTGDSLVNALLYSKNKEATDNKIDLFYVPSESFPDFPCEKHELIEIIGNLIDNAFEYVKTLEPEKRKVIIRINEKSIEVRNSFFTQGNENLDMMSKKGYSTKKGDGRGYGLYNVKCVAVKYNGKLNIYSEEDKLVVQVLF